jgi:hypothetical protein
MVFSRGLPATMEASWIVGVHTVVADGRNFIERTGKIRSSIEPCLCPGQPGGHLSSRISLLQELSGLLLNYRIMTYGIVSHQALEVAGSFNFLAPYKRRHPQKLSVPSDAAPDDPTNVGADPTPPPWTVAE